MKIINTNILRPRDIAVIALLTIATVYLFALADPFGGEADD